MHNHTMLPDTLTELSELHDAIITKLALVKIQDNEIEEILNDMNEAEADVAYTRYIKSSDKKIQRFIRNEVKRTNNSKPFKKALPRILQTAAIIIAILSIGLTAAIAAVPTVRDGVLKLLINMQEQYTELQLLKKQGSDILVPEGWEGEYFPSYIPEQFVPVEVKKIGDKASVSYLSESNKQLVFWEINDASTISVDTEIATKETVLIQGNVGFMSYKEGLVYLSWAHYDKWFWISFEGYKDEAIKIANSICLLKK